MVKSQYLLYLKSLSFFHGLENQLLKTMVAASTFLEINSQENIKNLLSHDEIIIVLKGGLKFHYENKQKKIIEIFNMKKGDTLSLESLLKDNSSRLVISASESTVLIKIPCFAINNLIMQQPALQHNLFLLLQENLRDSYHTLTDYMVNRVD